MPTPSTTKPGPSKLAKITAMWAFLTALFTILAKFVGYLPPAKTPEEQQAKNRSDDVSKIHNQDEQFKKDRDTSNLGDLD